MSLHVDFSVHPGFAPAILISIDGLGMIAHDGVPVGGASD